MTSMPGRWSKFAGMCVTNKHTSIPGTGLPVTAFTTVPEIRGVPIWKGDILSKNVTKFPGASFQKRTRTPTTKRKRTPKIKGKYGKHNLIFDRRSEDSNAAIAH
jgi:hypothetical protein